ncbi:MAG: PQQ-dependent sugar dehydrogenase [Chloroflexi bacterium]|nr:PQQ-dependent sugar dehydrogenase [Chloroflexota bacterium]
MVPTTPPDTPTAVPPTFTPISTDQPTATPTITSTPTNTPIPVMPVAHISFELIADGFIEPVDLTHAGDERIFVVERPGTIRIIQDGAVLPQPFLNIGPLVGDDASERGLLGLAFHPQYAENGRFFVYYTDNSGGSVISRYQVSADPNQADPDSALVILTLAQPDWNHNGGQIAFGPDGYLYVALGDGGGANDQYQNGQNTNSLLGTLLRLDVDFDESGYAIPADNPFVNDDAVRNEIWAYGLRNPWRFSFDRLTDNLFIADVGQNLWEEIHMQPADSSGGENYGWPILEGSHCFQTESCDPTGLELPIFEYPHGNGSCSITGGYVYRGQQYLELYGNYILADYCSGIFWSLFPEADGSWTATELTDTPHFVSSFGEDVNGELYFLSYGEGSVYQVRP